MKNPLFLLCYISFVFFSVKSQDIQYTAVPANLQLFPRDTLDSAVVTIAGNVTTLGFDSVLIKIYINTQFKIQQAAKLSYGMSSAPFSLSYKLHADTVLYKFVVSLKTGGTVTDETTIDSVVCGDIFLVDGQSNAVATAGDATVKPDKFLRSFGNLNESLSSTWVAYNPADTLWGLAKNHSVGNFCVGAWEFEMMKKLKETFGIPIGMINGAGSGSSITLHKRNVSNPIDLSANAFYGKLLYRVQKAHVAGKVKAIFWHQGEADIGFSSGYYNNFKTIHNEWMQDYPNVKNVFLYQISLLGSNNPDGSALREVQRSIPDSLTNCRIMTTVGLPGTNGGHYFPVGYETMGDWMYKMVAQELYQFNYGYNAGPPNVLNAFYTTSNRDTIAIILRNKETVNIQQSILNGGVSYYLSDMFYLDGVSGHVTGVYSSNDTIFLILNGPSQATKLTYLPNAFYPGTSIFYNGPWIMGTNGVGMLTFNNVLVGCQNNRFPVLKPGTLSSKKNIASGTIVDTINATDPDGDHLFYSITSGNSSNTFVIDSVTGVLKVQNPPTSALYNLSIKVHDDGICGLATAASFLVNCTPNSENDPKLDYHLIIYPNPTNGNFEVQYDSDTQGTIVLKIYDITGHEVTVISDYKDQPHYTRNINLNDCHGMYLLYLYDKDKVSIKKIIID